MKKFCSLIMMLLGLLYLCSTSVSYAAPGKVLVAYFSRADENYEVGYIQKGNTEIVAEIIAAKTHGDLFDIKKTEPYPAKYDDCTTVASREKAMNLRPALTATVPNMDAYDVIFLGYPIWYGDMPMPVYTFLDSYDFVGKTIIPFCTHGGSGLSGTEQRLMLACPQASLLKGLALRGSSVQENPQRTEQEVTTWLGRINMLD
ncbi:MAG: NAD(P)H-dependent oxidoreductase [Selenomonas sp.]|nr:NAD(P)H-dependent oxidoreductase [Selenomonas sp.]